MKDWTGDTNSVVRTLGSSAHAKEDREEHDYYATEPVAVEMLCELETFSPNIWECACGEGHIVLQIGNRFNVANLLLYAGMVNSVET